MAVETNTGPLVFGEVLFDSFPDGGRVLGGAPFNVAWHLQAWGAAPLLVSRIGVDDAGDAVRDRMRNWGMNAAGLQRDKAHPTGSVAVTYDDGEPSFEILPDQAYDFIDAAELPEASKAPLLYHGSLAVRSSASSAALQRLKTDGPPVFVDVNLRDPWWTRDQVLGFVTDARWAKLNEDELAMLAGSDDDVGATAAGFRERMGLEMLVVTLGSRGAMAVTASESAHISPASGIRVVDPVGAGDAFASVLILGLLRQWPLQQTLERAQSFASRVVERQGATVDDPDFYSSFCDQWGIR